jgi:hypothetical protein
MKLLRRERLVKIGVERDTKTSDETGSSDDRFLSNEHPELLHHSHFDLEFLSSINHVSSTLFSFLLPV